MMGDFELLQQELAARMPHNRSLRGWLGVFPATIALIGFIIVIGLLTGGDTPADFAETLDRYGLSYQMLRDGRFWHLLTGTFIQSDPGIAWSMILLLVTSLVPCEYLAGSKRMLITFFTCDWIGSLLMVISIRLLAAMDVADAVQRLSIPDAGSSAAAHGCMAAAAMLLPRRLAFVAYGLLFGVTTVLLFQQELDAAIAHLAAVLMGGALGWFFWRPAVEAENAGTPIVAVETGSGANLPVGRN